MGDLTACCTIKIGNRVRPACARVYMTPIRSLQQRTGQVDLQATPTCLHPHSSRSAAGALPPAHRRVYFADQRAAESQLLLAADSGGARHGTGDRTNCTVDTPHMCSHWASDGCHAALPPDTSRLLKRWFTMQPGVLVECTLHKKRQWTQCTAMHNLRWVGRRPKSEFSRGCPASGYPGVAHASSKS
jgi:hypothetical protein